MAEIYIQLSLLKPRETTPELSAVNYNLLAAKAVQCTWTFSQRCALSFRAKQMTLTIFNKYLVGSYAIVLQFFLEQQTPVSEPVSSEFRGTPVISAQTMALFMASI